MNTNNQTTLINFIETKVHGKLFVLKMKSRLRKLSETNSISLEQLFSKKASSFSLASLPFIFDDKATKKKVMMKLVKNLDNKLSFPILKSIFSPIISMSFLDSKVVLNYFKNAGDEDLKVFSMLLEKFYKRGQETLTSLYSSINPKIVKARAKALFKPEQSTLPKVALNKLIITRFNESKMRQKIKSLKSLLETSFKLDDLTKKETNSLKQVMGQYMMKIKSKQFSPVVRNYCHNQAHLKKKVEQSNDLSFLENKCNTFNEVNYIIKKISGGFMISIIKSLTHNREFRRGSTIKNGTNGGLFLPGEKARNALLFMTNMCDISNRTVSGLSFLELEYNYVIISSWIAELTGLYYQSIISSTKSGQMFDKCKETGIVEYVSPVINTFSNMFSNDKSKETGIVEFESVSIVINTPINILSNDQCTPLSTWIAKRFDLNSNWLLALKQLLFKNFGKGGNKKEINTFLKLYKNEQNHLWKFYEQNGVAIYDIIPKELIRKMNLNSLNKLVEISKYSLNNPPGYLMKYLQFMFKTQIESIPSHSKRLNSMIRYLSTKTSSINEIAIEHLKSTLTASLTDLEKRVPHELAETMSTMYQVNSNKAKSILSEFIFKLTLCKSESILNSDEIVEGSTTNLERKKIEIVERLKFKQLAINIIKLFVENMEKLGIFEWDFLQLILKQFGYGGINLKSKVKINSVLKKNNLCVNQKRFLFNLIEKQNSLLSYFLKKSQTDKGNATDIESDPIKNLVSVFIKRPSLDKKPELKEIKKLREMTVQQNELSVATIMTISAIELQNIGLDYCT